MPREPELPVQSRLHNLQSIANAFLFGIPDVVTEEGTRRLAQFEKLFEVTRGAQSLELSRAGGTTTFPDGTPLPPPVPEAQWLLICRELSSLYGGFKNLGYIRTDRKDEVNHLDLNAKLLDLAAALPMGYVPPAEAAPGGPRP